RRYVRGYRMLPGIRSVLIAIVAAIALLMGASAMVATFRVAQESRSGSLQAALAQGSRVVVAAHSEPRAVTPIEKPAPLEPSPVPPVEIRDTPELPAPILATVPQAEITAIEP